MFFLVVWGRLWIWTGGESTGPCIHMKSPPFRPVAGSSIRSPKEPRKPLKTLFGIAICLDMTWAELRPLNLLLFNRLRFVARLCLLAWVCQERMLEPSLINARSVQCQFCTVTVFSLQPCHMSYHVVANKCYTDISDVFSQLPHSK